MKTPGTERDRRLQLASLAANQGGYFTARQATSAGYSSRLQHHHATVGNWRRIERGIYRLPIIPWGPHEEFVVASLWSGGKAVISHDSALSFYQLSDLLPDQVHLTVPRTFRKRRDGIVLHRSSLRETDARKQQGFLVTTPLQTIADAAASTLSPEHLEQAVRDGLRQGLFRTKRLADLALDLPQSASVRLRAALRAVEAGA